MWSQVAITVTPRGRSMIVYYLSTYPSKALTKESPQQERPDSAEGLCPSHRDKTTTAEFKMASQKDMRRPDLSKPKTSISLIPNSLPPNG